LLTVLEGRASNGEEGEDDEGSDDLLFSLSRPLGADDDSSMRRRKG